MSCIAVAGTRRSVIALAATVCGFVEVGGGGAAGTPIGLLLALTYAS